MKHRKIRALLCLLLALVCLAGCGAVTEDTPSSPAPAQPQTTQPIQTPAPQTGEEILYSLLFRADSQVRLDIRMEEAEIAKMQEDHAYYSRLGSKSPIYRMADLEVTVTSGGETYVYTLEQVGVRMKGNTSRCDFYDEKDGIYNLIHLKISFQETFDDPDYYGAEALTWTENARKERKNRTFATLEKLDLKWNRCDDTTYIRETYAYDSFRQAGILAPHTAPASVDWAGIHLGVFTIYEPVDEVFLSKYLPEDAQGGDLYKCGWTGRGGADMTRTDSIGIEDEDAGQFFAFDLTANKKTSQHTALLNLIGTLNGGSLTRDQLADLVDTDYFLRFCAVSWLLGNPDDFRNNYNNYYLYFRPNDGKAIFIPYDYDRCMGITRDWVPSGGDMTGDDPVSLTLAANGSSQSNPLLLYTVCRGGYYTAEYMAYLEQLAPSVLSYTRFEARYWEAKKQYDALSTPGKLFGNAEGFRFSFQIGEGSGNLTVSDYMTRKSETLVKALASPDTGADPQVPARYYIRAEFTDWEVRQGYEMEYRPDRGVYTCPVSGTGRLKLKVYDRVNDEWYGTEVLAADSPLSCGSEGRGNILLPPGAYVIAFHPEEKTVSILPAEG